MMVERPVAAKPQTEPAVAAAGFPRELSPAPTTPPAHLIASTRNRMSRWQAAHDLACHRAETDRVKVLVDFLARPICAHGGTEPDPDIVTAYNLAVEAALNGIRRASQASPG